MDAARAAEFSFPPWSSPARPTWIPTFGSTAAAMVLIGADLMQWRKDFWPMSLFQYGNAMLPDGRNATEFLAVTTVAVERDDLKTSIWRVLPAGML